MKIHYRGLYHDRVDAPFLGSLVFAMDCDHNCPGCCHAGRRTDPVLETTSEEIIQEVLDYKFSEGIILGGFEWTQQPKEMFELIDLAMKNNLKVILYTHRTEEEMHEMFPELYTRKGVYVKYGEYRLDLPSKDYTSYGVPLASTNQYIKIID